MITRRHWSSSLALLGTLLAAFAVLTATALAGSGTGSSFNLGKTNSVSRQSVLTGSAGRTAQLKVRNRGRGPAIEAVVRRGAPPFKVNSSGKVANLNADLLDGLDSARFYRAGSTVANANALDGLDGPSYQRRITGSCAAGTAIRAVNVDGTVGCELFGTAFWRLSGNAGTDPAANFLGTIDAQPLVFKTSGNEALRVNPVGNVGVGTTTVGARLEVVTPNEVAVRGTAPIAGGDSMNRAVIGRLGQDTLCPGSYGVGGCAGASGHAGVFGRSELGFGVSGSSESSFGVVGQSGSGTGVFGQSIASVGVRGASDTRAVVGTRLVTDCPGDYAVGGCTSGVATGVFGRSITDTGVTASTDTGNIFLGVTGAAETPQARIDNTGKGFFNGGTQNSGADYAESMRTSEAAAALEPGDVLAIDPSGGPAVHKSRRPNSPLVAGVYSTRPAVLAVGEHGVDASLAGEVPVALLGVVPTKVSAENGRIRAGDLLTSARTPGHAMKAKPVVLRGVRIYPTGVILGKALQPLGKGMGVIKVLVMLR